LDAGGVLLNEMESNIIHCVQEKSKKILNYKHKYDDWWLALVDNIGYDLSDYDRDMLKKDISIAHDWDKLIIINPHNITRSFEI
jgi:aminoglycoside/choline kinase family phosphotransferase